MFLGYNTNGLAHHDLFDAVELLADIGYRGIGITIDHNALSPYGEPSREVLPRLRRLLERLGMRSVIETGARFLLDPSTKYEPTLLSTERRHRIDFYKYAIDCAAALGSDCFSLWSGAVRESISTDQAMDRLIEGLHEVLDYAAQYNVTIAFEPEPGMLIDTMQAYQSLLEKVDAPKFRLTLDIGHLHCQGETPIADVIRRWAPRLANVHVEDTRRGVHEHLMFGEGEIDFPPVLQALRDITYNAGIYVELSRHSHEGPDAARKAIQFLRAAEQNGPVFPSPPGQGTIWKNQ